MKKVKIDILKNTTSTNKINYPPNLFSEYLTVISNFFSYCNRLSEDELASVALSLQNWMTRRKFTQCLFDYKIGDICYADLGMTYTLECSYPHPVVIVEKIGNMVLVIPSTTSLEKVNEAYHPTIRPDGNKYLRLIERDEDGFKETSALMLANARTINEGRLLSKLGSMRDISNPESTFREIKNFIFRYYSPKEYSNYSRQQQHVEELKQSIEKLAQDNLELDKQNEELIKELKKYQSIAEKTG